MYRPIKIISETTSVSQSTADWYRQVFVDASGSLVTVTENGGDLPSNSAKIQVVRNGVIQAIGEDYTVVEPNINFVEALDTETVIVTFLSDEDTTSTLVDDIVPLADAKKHLKVDFGDDDELIQMYIKTARQWVENHTGRALVPKTIEQSFPGFPIVSQNAPHRELRLTWGPLIQVDNIKYWDTESPQVQQTIDGTDLTDNFITDLYHMPPVVTPRDGYTVPDTGTRKYPVTVQYQAGYSSTDLVPQPIKQGMLLLIADLYENRGSFTRKQTSTVEFILANEKVPHFPD